MKTNYVVDSFKNFTVLELYDYMKKNWNTDRFNYFYLDRYGKDNEECIILPATDKYLVRIITKIPDPKKRKRRCEVYLILSEIPESIKERTVNSFSKDNEIYDLYEHRKTLSDKKEIAECEDDIVLKYAVAMRLLLMRF